jgi:hypothetical protein
MRTMVARWLILAGCAHSTGAKRSQGIAFSPRGFAYLGKFVFDYEAADHDAFRKKALCPDGEKSSDVENQDTAQFTVTLTNEAGDRHMPMYPNGDRQLQLYIYSDQDHSWGRVWPPKENQCEERKSVVATSWGKGWFKVNAPLPCDGLINVSKGENLHARHSINLTSLDANLANLTSFDEFKFTRNIFLHLRPRIFYVVLGHADCKKIENIKYDIHFTNPGGWVDREFGVNEQGLAGLYIFFLLAYVGLIALQRRSRKLTRRNYELPQMLTAVLGTACLSCFLFTVHFVIYTFDGDGEPLLKFFAELVQAASQLIMLLMLVLLAQGWTVVRMEMQSRPMLIAGMAVLGTCTFFVLLWGEYPTASQDQRDQSTAEWLGRDAASTKYIYRETPGIFLSVLELVAAGVFLATISKTIKKCEELLQMGQLAFMKKVAVGFGAYLAVVPIFVLCFATAIDDWQEETWVRYIEVTVAFAANGAMVYLIWPTREGRHFMASGLEAGLRCVRSSLFFSHTWHRWAVSQYREPWRLH